MYGPMHLSLPWAGAIAAAALVATLLALGLTARRGAMANAERPLLSVAHLLAGGLAGFITIATPPAAFAAWPIVGVLAIRALQAPRKTDAGLVAVGFGGCWIVLLGARMINDALDPAVTSVGNPLPALVVGAAILAAGLGLAVLPEKS